MVSPESSRSISSTSVKAKPKFKFAVAAAVIAATAIAFVSFRTPGVSADREHDHDGDESKIQIGFSIAPVPLNYEHRDRRLVGLGSYLVNAQMDCNGCHSQGPQTEYIGPGNPYLLSPPYQGTPITNPATYLGGGRDFGPFGTHAELTHLYSRNLTPDKTGRAAGGMHFEEFLNVLRTGKDYDNVHPNCTGGVTTGSCLLPPFNGEVLQVMPWPVHQNMTEHDIRAIYEYLSSIPCIDTTVSGAPYLHNDCD